jgi:hypothetical protein
VDALARALVEEAMEPLRHSLHEANVRMADLERRLAAALAAPPPQPTPVAYAAISPAAASAPNAHAASVAPVQYRSVPPVGVLVREALASDVALNPSEFAAFDGGRRRRRQIFLFVFFLVVVFGGLFAMLAESYTPHR